MMTIRIVDSSSFEALAFDYFRFGLFGVVNNLWTLVAVATAAVSFWKFKLAPFLDRLHVRVSSPEVEADCPSSSRPKVNGTGITPPPEEAPVAESFESGVVAGRRVYSRFCYDDVIDEEELVEEDEEWLVRRADKMLRFDASERLRLLDLGFYVYQDMRVLDGNVVKLWDGCRVRLSPRATASAAMSAAMSAAVSGGQMWDPSRTCNKYEICLKGYGQSVI